MATVELFPQTVTTVLGTPTVTGTLPWDGHDDGTSVDLTQAWDGVNFTRFDRVKSDLGILGGTPTSHISVHMRASAIQLSGPAGIPVSIKADVAIYQDPTFSPFVRAGDTDIGLICWAVPADGLPHDFSVDLSADAPTAGTDDYYAANFTTESAFISLLQSGATAQVQVDLVTPSPPISQRLTVYDLWVECTVADVIPTAAGQPPLRMTNRDDHYTSARRLTGSRSRQGSNRLTGYL